MTRVLAHRRVWLRSAGAEMTASQREQLVPSFDTWDAQPNSRVRLEGESERTSRLLYDLLGRVNGRNAEIAQLFDAGQDPSSVSESLLTKIDRVFALANLGISFRVTNVGEFEAVRPTGVAYPISEMSDGEKGAFLLAAEVLLAPPDCVQLVDEPERHLHRAISSDFVVSLMRERTDCAFVLLTHDLDLIGKLESTTTTVCSVSEVSWGGATATGWGIEIDSGAAEVPDSVRQAILGGRTQLLFVEGEVSSLDFPLYRLVFPDWTVVPCGGAEEVKRATSGLNGVDAYHWVDGRGVLDGDARSPEEVAALGTKKILVLPVDEVENLYYLSCVVDAVADHQAATLGEDAEVLKATVRGKAMESLKASTVQHLASVNAVKILRSQALASMPTGEDMINGGADLPISLSSPYPAERQKLVDLVASQDYDAIVRGYSVRDSGLRTAVAHALGFKSLDLYEKAVRVLLGNNEMLLTQVRKIVGDLPS
ncbi:AAA family ATPase [Nocardioides koreensis]|uniref:AAA family ATPase n=1 Tax=Nocardioides koreensis TaxID=433651 RepID=UPI0031CDF133